MTFSCGQCIGCRIDRSRDWAVRCVHESQTHQNNIYITLTYSDQELPSNGSLLKKDFQDFMKALRHQHTGQTIRYFMCGEYGEKNYRPHFHAIIFGLHFTDKKLWQVKNGHNLYRSTKLETIWTKGFSTIGDATWQSAAYVARYIMKKINGPKAVHHYERWDKNGEITDLLPEYTDQSNRPGIGYAWYQKYKHDIFPGDFVPMNGKKYPVPRYYDKLLERENPDLLAAIKKEREERAQLQKNKENSTPERLGVREICKEQQLSSLKRDAI